ncbi:MAG: hypothetical protein AAF249_06335 [Pseudomonadota bacterium]
MSALPPEQARDMRHTLLHRDESGLISAALPLAARWRRLHQKAADVARMADLSPEPFGEALASFPERLTSVSTIERQLAEQGLEDIEAMLRPGLSALATLSEREASSTAPALALWREFYDARGAVLALAEDGVKSA